LNQNLSTVFRNWVDAFHQFFNCACPKWKTIYFIESLTEECRKKGKLAGKYSISKSCSDGAVHIGLELFKAVPNLGKFNFCAGNYFIDPEELKSTQARMVNNFIWYEQDMAKFPRFPLQKKVSPTTEFPSILTAK